jgi:hypothetical protein
MNGRHQIPLEVHPNASVLTPTRVAASGNGAAFDMDNVDLIFATQGIHAFLETALTGTNNDIAFVARTPGAGGTAITIAIVVSGNNTALSISVSTNAITINSATNGSGTAISTAAEVIAAIKAHAAANALVHVENKTGNDGTGAVVALSAANLIDVPGSSPTLDQKLQSSQDGGTTWIDATGGPFAQVAAIAGSGGQRNMGLLAKTGRWVSTLGGTGSPIFWFTIIAKARL